MPQKRWADSCVLRWYPGIDLDERAPDHRAIIRLRRRKPAFRVVRQCVEKGLVSGKLMAADSTHV